MKLRCLNKSNEDLYVLHLPGNGLAPKIDMVNEFLDIEISISKDLSIISVMDQKCWDESFIVKQCKKNNIKIYNTALDLLNWNNTLKIEHVLKCLNEIKTKYVLILDGRDTVITSNLDDTFIEKYLSFNKPIVYNATPFAYPKVAIEPLQDLLSITGTHKFLNAGVCIGEKDSLIEFYTKAAKINSTKETNRSEQYIIRLDRLENMDAIGLDSNTEIFRILHQADTVVNHIDKYTYRLT